MKRCPSLAPVSLKNVYTIFDDAYTHLSPVNGAAMVNSHWLENFARWSMLSQDAENISATQRLVMDEKLGLFTTTPEFKTTSYQSRPAAFFTAEIIGELILLLEYTLFLDATLPWKEACTKLKFEEGSITQQSREQVVHFLNAAPEHEVELNAILTRINNIIQKTAAHAIKIKDTQHPIKNNLIRDFIMLLRDSALECAPHHNALYSNSTTRMILLSFLYLHYKISTPNYLHDYFTTLNNFNNNIVNTAAYDCSAFTPDDFTSLLSELSTIVDSEQQIVFLQKNYERVVQFMEKPHEFPEAIRMERFCYKLPHNATEIPTPTRPDCVESALLDALVNSILFNPQTKEYDITLLPPAIQECMLQDLKDFVNEVPAQTINTPLVRQRWFNMLSGHTGDNVDSKKTKLSNGAYLTLEYTTDNKPATYELTANVENVINIANYLYGTAATTMEDFGKTLSTPTHAIVFETTNTNDAYTITLSLPLRTSPLEGTLTLTEKHVSFALPARDQKNSLNLNADVPALLLHKLQHAYHPSLEGLLMLTVTPQTFTHVHSQPEKNLFYWSVVNLTFEQIPTQVTLFTLLTEHGTDASDSSIKNAIENFWDSSPRINVEVLEYLIESPKVYSSAPALMQYMLKHDSLLLIALDEYFPVHIIEHLIQTVHLTARHINATNQWGQTPLLQALKNPAYHTIAEYLATLEETDINHQDNSGETALSYCKKHYPSEKIYSLLLNRKKIYHT